MKKDNIKKYWKDYYRNNNVVNTKSLQKNVGRTRNGIPVSNEIWLKTIKYIKEIIKLDRNDSVLELCCGNGQVIGELSKYCKYAIGVDYSKELLNQLKKKYNNVKLVYSDILDVAFENNYFDVIIIYFSIQHFDDNDVVKIVENSINWLVKGGRLFIGDIPNETEMWEYIREQKHKIDYIKRVVNESPLIGNWFNPLFFEALGCYFNNINVEIIEQPEYQINSDYRFDVLITKK